MDELSESHSEHTSVEGMRMKLHENEVAGQVKYKNIQYRSRYDIRVNLCQQQTLIGKAVFPQPK